MEARMVQLQATRAKLGQLAPPSKPASDAAVPDLPEKPAEPNLPTEDRYVPGPQSPVDHSGARQN